MSSLKISITNPDRFNQAIANLTDTADPFNREVSTGEANTEGISAAACGVINLQRLLASLKAGHSASVEDILNVLAGTSETIACYRNMLEERAKELKIRKLPN